MTRIQIHLTTLQLRALKHRRQQTGLSVAEQVRRALDAYLLALPVPRPRRLYEYE